MKALVKSIDGVRFHEVAEPQICHDLDVIVRVHVCGICRTDLHVASGEIQTEVGRVFGHEFSGVVFKTGRQVKRVKIGDRVAANPLVACLNCSFCKCHEFEKCTDQKWIGIDRDGCYAEFIKISEHQLHLLPAEVSDLVGAYVEPIAASAAVLKAGIKPNEKGLIFGDNRIASLTHRILQANGYHDVEIYRFQDTKQKISLPQNHFDYIVETIANADVMRAIIAALKPHGKLVIKSRSSQLVGIDFRQAIQKEITFQAVNYQPFTDVIQMIQEGHVQFNGLFGEVFAAQDYQKAFHLAETDTSKKVFLSFVDQNVRHS